MLSCDSLVLTNLSLSVADFLQNLVIKFLSALIYDKAASDLSRKIRLSQFPKFFNVSYTKVSFLFSRLAHFKVLNLTDGQFLSEDHYKIYYTLMRASD